MTTGADDGSRPRTDELADDADAWLRSVTFGDRLAAFLEREINPLAAWCHARDADPATHVFRPMAALLRKAADRLEAGP